MLALGRYSRKVFISRTFSEPSLNVFEGLNLIGSSMKILDGFQWDHTLQTWWQGYQVGDTSMDAHTLIWHQKNILPGRVIERT